MAETMLGEPENQNTEGTPATAATAEPEVKATEGQQAQQQQKQEPAKAEPAKPAAPEKYEFKAPDGQQFDPEVLKAYEGVARELGLSQEGAQKVLDAVAPKLQEQQQAIIDKAQAQWAESSKADKEFGGEKLKANLAVAKKALDKFGTPELRKLLDDSGLGNHPELIRAFYRAGKAISEDGFVSGSARSSPNADPAKRLFPNMA